MNKDRQSTELQDKLGEMLNEQMIPKADELGSQPAGKSAEPTLDNIDFEITPEELIDHLRGYLVGQTRAIETVATKICTHFHRMNLERKNPKLPRIVGDVKSNMLLIGPTGVGKTYLIKLIANKLRVPFVKGDATKFSETGYVGGDVEDLIRELVFQVGGNIEMAEYGIVYIDEIDKIASSGSWWGPDVSRSGVQRNLLKLMEETEVDMKVPHDLASQMEAVMETQRTGQVSRKKVNTRNILFVMSGAFSGLPEIIARRLKQGGMGFTGTSMSSAEDHELMLEHMHSMDLTDYGFETEFVGRVPIVTWMNELDADGLYGILTNTNSAVIQGKKRDFAAYGIEVSFDNAALTYIASEAVKHKTGARGLVTVMESILMPFERSLPSSGVKRLRVTLELCQDPDAFLNSLLDKHAFESFGARFLRSSGIELTFSRTAKEMAIQAAATKGISLRAYFEDLFVDYEHGLQLVGKKTFNVTQSVLKDANAYLNNLVKKHYQDQS